MDESKIDLTHRLKQEGRWSEASKWKDEKIAELRQSGATRKEAGAVAWEAMAEKYPPLPSDQQRCTCHVPQLSDDDVEEILGRSVGEAMLTDVARDAEWVYQHMDVANVHAVLAPSIGAWGLLHWARENRKEFYKEYWPKHAPQKSESAEQPDRPLPDPEAVDEMLARLLQVQEQSVVDNTPTSVILDVQHRFFAWEQNHKLQIPREARKDLEELMVGIVCNARRAFQRDSVVSTNVPPAASADDVPENPPGGPMDI